MTFSMISQLSGSERCSAATMQANNCFPSRRATCTSAARAGCTSTGAASSIPKDCRRSAGSSATREEFDTVEINASFYRAAARIHVRRVARKGAARLPLCGQGQPLHHAYEEADGLRGGGGAVHRLARPLGENSGRCSTSCRRASIRTRPPGVFLARLPATSIMSSSSGIDSWYERRRPGLLDRYGIGFVTHRPQGTPIAALGERADGLRSLPRHRGQISWALLRRGTDWLGGMVSRPDATRPERLVLFQQRHPRSRDRRRANVEVDGQANGPLIGNWADLGGSSSNAEPRRKRGRPRQDRPCPRPPGRRR